MAARFLTEFGLKVKGILPRKKKIEDVYEIKSIIGSGNYSVVKYGVHKKTGEEVALKIIEKELVSDYERENLSTEIEILREYGNHPNIITLKEVFEDRKRLILVLEFMKGGELLQRIRKKKRYSEKEASYIIKKVVQAAAYLHKNGIVHRDFKPENLLFTSEEEDAELKIADFGFARYIGEGFLKTPCGSPAYVAPEIVKEQNYNKSVDMWSIGVILYILLCGFPPFYHENTEKIFLQIQEGKFDFPPPYWTKISASAKELVSLLLKVDPKERITAEDTLLHPWIVGFTASEPLEASEKVIRNCSENGPRNSEDKRTRRVKTKSKKDEILSKAERPKEDRFESVKTKEEADKEDKSKGNSKEEIKDKRKKPILKTEKSSETFSSSTVSDPSFSDDSWSE